MRYTPLVVTLSGAAAVGFLVGGTVLYITWQHNPQCEFHCDGVINWSHWLLYGFAYWLVGFVIGIPIAFLGALVLALFKKR